MALKLLPSMMCCNYLNVKGDLDIINEEKVDFLHCDIMDGHYVPNMIVGPDFIKTIRKYSKAPLDVHLMVEKPENFYKMFDMQPGERMSFHYETTYHPHRMAKTLKAMGVKVGVALAPATPLVLLEDMIVDIDFIHIMSVNPGFAGQPMIPQMLDKIERAKKMVDEAGVDVDIEVDGCIDYANITTFAQKGTGSFVLGPFSCFDKEIGISAALKKVKGILTDAGYELASK